MATAVYEIPLQPNTPQTLSVSLAGVTYGLTLVWNNTTQSWTLNIDDSSGSALIHGIPLITGADLLGQYQYIGIAGSLYASTDFNLAAPPTFGNLGVTGHLYFVSLS